MYLRRRNRTRRFVMLHCCQSQRGSHVIPLRLTNRSTWMVFLHRYHFLGLLYPCFPSSRGWCSPRLRHRASPGSKGGTIVWLIPTRSTRLGGFCLGQSPNDARRACCVSLRSTCEPDCSSPPRSFCHSHVVLFTRLV